MNLSRIERIRAEERSYHEACYDAHVLFEAGSWLHKPVKTVMELLSYFDAAPTLHMLDLGCGVGRNSIPMAQTLLGRSGSVVCVDLLESALSKLMQYSGLFGVSEYIKPCLSEIGRFEIQERTYDFIVAVSALEHVDSEAAFSDTLDRMAAGTKTDGINCIVMSTNIREIDLSSGERQEPRFEINFTQEEAERQLRNAYEGWDVLIASVKELTFTIERQGRPVELKGDCVTYAVRKRVQ